ncbi:hypothetical protein NQ318_000131 [Aromia moschata]|uniref:Rho GTPase activating protein n=1 Tax=Aromia moschata TaxID=1265417 RepID=A0AAV8XI84_9CUCU|nr:hypothetical protein NQ318_000131 [Aromia moschata]
MKSFKLPIKKQNFCEVLSHQLRKKISPSAPASDIEKLLKKTFEYQLSTSFIEESRQYRECRLFQEVLREAGLIEQQLAREYAEHEMKVEEMVYAPFQNVLENEFPNVIKYKHNLRKYCLDKDSASNRYHATRKETLKDDMEEADTKVEQSRDQLAIEMFNILAKENEFSEYILQLLKLQRGYHESALKNLETIIPQLEKKIGDSPIRRVFGTSLQEHLRITNKRIAFPLEICITALSDYGMLEEGLFRVAASATKVKRLKSAIDSGCFSWLIPEYRDAHVLASILKLYLRELPEPLLTFHLHKDWIDAMHSPESRRLETVKAVIKKLPQENKDNLSYLFHFLFKLTQHAENKMSPSNIAIVLSPNLLWTKSEKENLNIGNCVVVNMLIEMFIKEVNILFPDDVSGYVTPLKIFQEDDVASHKSSSEIIDLKLGSPKPNVRKKKSAPVPPNNERAASHNLKSPGAGWKASMENLTTDDSVTGHLYLKLDDNVTNSEQNADQTVQEKCLKTNMEEVIVDITPPDEKEPVSISQSNYGSKLLLDKPVPDEAPSVKPAEAANALENLRRKEPGNVRQGKPEVPARPLSLTKKPPSDAFKKTHCSVYNVADKLHPSIINIETKNELSPSKLQDAEPQGNVLRVRVTEGKICDTRMAKTGNRSEVGATEAVDGVNGNRFNEQRLSSGNGVASAPQKGSHTRAKSDGGLVDLDRENGAFLQGSPYSLNQPIQTPPSPSEI